MISIYLSTIALIINAKRIGEDCVISSISIDSSSSIGKNGLFIAIKGKKFDSHDFAEQAINSGAIALVVDRLLPFNVPQLIVTNTYYALAKLSSWVRRQVPSKVIAITGSSGKTSVKEMTAAILKQRGNVLATYKNFNNSIGVPITLLRLTLQHDFAVIELGASNPGEISWKSCLVQPNVVLINNIFASHLSGFGSLLGVAKSKGEIFSGLLDDGIVVLNADNHDWTNWKKDIKNRLVWRFSMNCSDGVDFFATNIIQNRYGVCFTMHTPQGECLIRMSLLGNHNISNALAASALSMAVGADISDITYGLSQIEPIPGRMFPIIIDKNKLLLDDTYNANFGSVIAAINVLKSMPGYRVMVISDMEELGSQSVEYHKKVNEAIAMSGINKVLSIGNLINFSKKYDGEHFTDKSKLSFRLKKIFSEESIITALIKGSRNFKMEEIMPNISRKIPC